VVASGTPAHSSTGVKLKARDSQGWAYLSLDPMTSTLPAAGDFTGLALSDWERQMIQTGYEAVTAVEGGWEHLKTYEASDGQGFMFSESTGLRHQIDEEIRKRYEGHSGASYGMTMRVLERIAKSGWESYAKEKLPKPSLGESASAIDSFFSTVPPTSDLTAFANAIQKDEGMRKVIPDMDQQADALRQYAEGKLSYGEMRSRCG
jgi:hypothetical protein